MAEVQENSAKGVAAPAKVPSGAKPQVAPTRAPGLEAANNPEWALRFLARVATKAISHKVLPSVRTWIYPQQEMNSLTGTISNVDNKERDLVLGEVVAELVRDGKLAADATKSRNDQWWLYHDCYMLGTVIIESRSAHQLVSNTMPRAIIKTLKLLEDAEPLWLSLRRAALQVKTNLKNMDATRRDEDLEAVLFPKNLRGRDGTIPDRIERVRYIQAIHALIQQARASANASADRDKDSRGLGNVPLNRSTGQSNPPDFLSRLGTLEPALEFLGRVVRHPDIVKFIEMLHWDSGYGKQFLTTMVMQSVSDAGALADKVKNDSRLVWRFRAALRMGIMLIDNLTSQEKDELTLFATAISPELKTSLDEALDALGVMTTLLMLFGGPIGVVAAVADAVVQSADATVSFLREIEQDRAESATIFDKESDRLSTGGHYLAPAAQAMGAILSAVSAFEAVKGVVTAASTARAAERTGVVQIPHKPDTPAVRGPVGKPMPEPVIKPPGSAVKEKSLQEATPRQSGPSHQKPELRAREGSLKPGEAEKDAERRGIKENVKSADSEQQKAAERGNKRGEMSELNQETRKISSGRPELEREASTIKQKIRDPENIGDVLDAELAIEYDFQVSVGGQHTYYHRRDGKGWCRASGVAICGYSFGQEVEDAVRKAKQMRRVGTTGKLSEGFVRRFLGPEFKEQMRMVYEQPTTGPAKYSMPYKGPAKYGMSIGDFVRPGGGRRIIAEVKDIDILRNVKTGFQELRDQVGKYLYNIRDPHTAKFWLFLDIRYRELPAGGFEEIIESASAGTGHVFDNIFLITGEGVLVY